MIYISLTNFMWICCKAQYVDANWCHGWDYTAQGENGTLLLSYHKRHSFEDTTSSLCPMATHII